MMSRKKCLIVLLLIASVMSLMLCGLVFGQETNTSPKNQPQQTKQKPTKTEPLPDMPAKVYEKVSPVTVMILCDKGKKNGSGVIIGLTEKGHAIILTACHVVASNFEDSDPQIALEFYKDVYVKTSADINVIRAGVIGSFVDRSNDLALLVTLKPVSVDRTIRYSFTEKIKPGEKVAAFGYPRSGKLSQTVGRITQLESKYLIFDAKIAPGSSGGPLIDRFGRMVGISTAIADGNEGNAVNMNLILSVVDNWLKGIKLKEKWEYQKYGSGFEKTIKSWPILTGSGFVALGGSLWAAGVFTSAETKRQQEEGTLTTPPTRP